MYNTILVLYLQVQELHGFKVTHFLLILTLQRWSWEDISSQLQQYWDFVLVNINIFLKLTVALEQLFLIHSLIQISFLIPFTKDRLDSLN